MQSLGSLSSCSQAGPASQAAGTVGGNRQLVSEGPSTNPLKVQAVQLTMQGLIVLINSRAVGSIHAAV